MGAVPDSFGVVDILKQPRLLRELFEFMHQQKNMQYILGDGDIRHARYTPKARNAQLILGGKVSAISAYRPPAAGSGPPIPSGLMQWLDASAITTIESGNAVGTGLVDLSGNGYNITSTSGSPRWIDNVTNGWPGVELSGGLFGGANKGLNNPYGVTGTDTPMSFAFACRATGRGFRFINPGGPLVGDGWNIGPGPAFAPYGSDGTDKWGMQTSPGNGSVSPTLLLDFDYTPAVFTRDASGAFHFWVRSTSYHQGDTEHRSPGTLNFGGASASLEDDYGFQGYFHEFFAWNRVLSNAERDTMFSYFDAKWGMPRPATPGDGFELPTEFPDPTQLPEESECDACIDSIMVDDVTGHVLTDDVTKKALTNT